MSFLADLADLMPDTATWRPFVSRDVYGAPTFGADVPIEHARLVREPKLVRTVQGDEAVSTAHLWLGTFVEVGPEDQVELSDGSTPEILSVERFEDELGDSHAKVYFR